MSLIIHSEKNADAIFEKATRAFMTAFENALLKKAYFDVALSGGSTAKQLFSRLKESLHGHKELKRIRFFFSDERVIFLDHGDSNAGAAIKLLFEPLGIISSQYFVMFDGKHDAGTSATNYEAILHEKLPRNDAGTPIFDLIYLGIGLDGHIASLFPESPLILDETSLVKASVNEGITYERISLMPRLLRAAEEIHVIATGKQKAKVIENILYGDFHPVLLPAQLVLKEPKNDVTLFLGEIDIKTQSQRF